MKRSSTKWNALPLLQMLWFMAANEASWVFDA